MSPDRLASPYGEPGAHDAAGATPIPSATGRRRRDVRVVVALQVLLVLALCVGAGLLCGVLWEWWWTAPRGYVATIPTLDHGVQATKHMWFPDGEVNYRHEFSGTGMFVVIALVGGIVVGGLTSWLLARAELVTLLAVAAGAVLASFLMIHLGGHFGPPDPQRLAAKAADGTRLPDHLVVTGGWTAYLLFPLGAVGSTALLMFIPRRHP